MMGFTPKFENSIPRLKKGQVHVWQMSLNHSIKQEDWEWLSVEEKTKINRLRDGVHRKSATSMRTQLRRLLSMYLDKSPAEISFKAAQFGKPYLDDSSLSFNISHSGDLALVAITLNQEVGIDIEKWRFLENLEGLVKRNFSDREQQAWLTVEDSQRQQTFFNLWTCKEAFIKATGRGLGMGVSRCGFSLTQPNTLMECPDEYGEMSEWSCFQLEVGEKVSACMMLRSKSCSPLFYVFDPENLPQMG
tara:strand:+ start:490 stop:1230 length:741 start_codon:yes stop_codon:yes gene_type:complete